MRTGRQTGRLRGMTKANADELEKRSLLASGGGNATASGVAFQASLGAWFASHLLSERRLNTHLGAGHVLSLRFETEAPVDDILVKTTTGRVFVEAKSTVTLSTAPNGALARVARQFVRQWLACSAGDGEHGWNRPLSSRTDRLLLAVGPKAPSTVSIDLADGLSTVQTVGHVRLSAKKAKAVSKFQCLLGNAWESVVGRVPSEADIDSISNLVTILKFDFGGAHRGTAEEMLKQVLDSGSQASAAFAVVEQHCQELMAVRSGCDMIALQGAVIAKGIALTAPPEFQSDKACLKNYSEQVGKQLSVHESTEVLGEYFRVERACTDAVVDAAREGSLLLVGEPGTGKSGVINASAARLREEGRDVLELAVDRLPVSSIEGLMNALGLQHPVREVLTNWPGSEPGILFIDALDATRGGTNEAVFRTLIEEVLSIESRQWHVIASIRTFDLRMGAQFKELFYGGPICPEFADQAFSDVTHVHVPAWTASELEQLLDDVHPLSDAIDSGGARLRELAHVPFNTRLICDLINAGLEPTAFSGIESQVQLLNLYWNRRVEKHGTKAEVCLRTAISEMIGSRALQARKLDVAKADGLALDALLHENVLVLVRDEQFVTFRHHILFDYAASRVYLRPDDPKHAPRLLEQGTGLGLMLAPALSYSLLRLWNDRAQNRLSFWSAVTRFCGDSKCDPVARSVAARAAAELPSAVEDANGLVRALMGAAGPPEVDGKMALGHVVGALTVGLEDQQPVVLAPWCRVAERASEHVHEWAWPLRALLYALFERADSEQDRNRIGRAARRLLSYCLETLEVSPQLTSAAIGFVAVTYSSDSDESRALLQKLFEPERFSEHGDQEVPRLVDRLKDIYGTDPEFVEEIYGRAFGGSIEDVSSTPIGQSQILSMVSTRRQDYESSWWQLNRFYPRFLRSNPSHAVRALVSAMSGYVDRVHPIDREARTWSVSSSEGVFHLREDRSCIWAWDTEEEQSDSALAMIKEFVKHLETAEVNVARQMIREIARVNELAVLWARTFMAASKRAMEIGDLLWSFATQEGFLECLDTQKDGIDFIVARYPFESKESREAFESRAIAFEFAQTKDAETRRREVLSILFSSVGEVSLVTQSARELVSENNGTKGHSERNTRPFRIVSGSGSGEKYWWLRDQGVDVEDDSVARILEKTEQVQETVQKQEDDADATQGIAGAFTLVSELFYLVTENTENLPESVEQYGLGIAAQGTAKLCSYPIVKLQENQAILQSLIDLVIRLARIPTSEWSAEDEAEFETSSSWGSPDAAVDTAEATMQLCRVDGQTVKMLLPIVEMFLVFRNPAARMQIAMRLMVFWNTAHEFMWELADRIVRTESNRGVLLFFANHFLSRARRFDAPRVEGLVFVLHARASEREEEASNLVRGEVGSLTALLSNYDGRVDSIQALKKWVDDVHTFEHEVRRAIGVTRNALVLKYQKESLQYKEVTQRAQDFVRFAVAAMCDGIEDTAGREKEIIRLPTGSNASVLYFKILDEICREIYFASGAFRSNERNEPALKTNEAKREFLSDMKATLSRIADVGAAPTIHHLIELLEFLLPGNPAEVFDLVACALLEGGRKSQYQFESLGAERVVKIVGVCLADHREIFDEDERRQTLVKCLDTFMEVGWPAARRLVYRLPELLQ